MKAPTTAPKNGARAGDTGMYAAFEGEIGCA
jgi:hypothetical protein